MKLPELKKEIQKYQYFEDTNIIDVSMASIIANRLKLGDPVWLIVIGASSGGKSQILRPIAQTDTKFIHRVDDVTENTFLSGAKAKEGEQVSLLQRIGPHGIMVISDFTVLMSKSSESRQTILSQFRMIHDGEMTKFSGNSKEPIKWKGYLGILAGSTPSIYAHFEEVSDMGERFIYYRMKDYSPRKATELALNRKIYGRELDALLADKYKEYEQDIILSHDGKDVELSPEVIDRITEVSEFAEMVRTPTHKDYKGEIIDRIPVPAMPMRVALQLMAIAKGLMIMRHHEDGVYSLNENYLSLIDWLGYSLANEEKRACLKILASTTFDSETTTSSIADKVGLDTKVVKVILQNLSAVGVLSRAGDDVSGFLKWSFKNERYYNIVRRIEHIDSVEKIENRDVSREEEAENDDSVSRQFQEF